MFFDKNWQTMMYLKTYFLMFQFEELLIVAISKEESDTEQFLSKKIGVFIRVVEFLYGPVTNE